MTGVGGPTVGQTMPLAIKYAGNNTWPVSFNYTKVGSSTDNPPYSEYLATGLESTSSSNVLDKYTVSNAVYYRDSTTGAWHSGWSANANIISDSPAAAFWHIKYDELYDYMNN